MGFWGSFYYKNFSNKRNVYSRVHGSPCSKLFYCKVSSGFLRQDSQSSYSFGIIQNAGVKEKLRLSLEKSFIFCFHTYFSCWFYFLLFCDTLFCLIEINRYAAKSLHFPNRHICVAVTGKRVNQGAGVDCFLRRT